MNAREYVEQLAQQSGMSEEDKSALLKAVSNEKAAKALEEGVMLRSDYSRQSDAVAAEKQKAATYYQSLIDWKAEQERLLAEATRGNGQPLAQPVNGEYLTKKELEALDKKYQEELNRREQVQIGLLEVGMQLATSHAVEFKEPLDTASLRKIAVDKQLSLKDAYNEMVGERRKAAAEAAEKTRLENMRAEITKEVLSKHHLPVDGTPREHHLLLDRDTKKQAGIEYESNSGTLSQAAERQLRDNFVDEWNKAGATSGT